MSLARIWEPFFVEGPDKFLNVVVSFHSQVIPPPFVSTLTRIALSYYLGTHALGRHPPYAISGRWISWKGPMPTSWCGRSLRAASSKWVSKRWCSWATRRFTLVSIGHDRISASIPTSVTGTDTLIDSGLGRSDNNLESQVATEERGLLSSFRLCPLHSPTLRSLRGLPNLKVEAARKRQIGVAESVTWRQYFAGIIEGVQRCYNVFTLPQQCVA